MDQDVTLVNFLMTETFSSHAHKTFTLGCMTHLIHTDGRIIRYGEENLKI